MYSDNGQFTHITLPTHWPGKPRLNAISVEILSNAIALSTLPNGIRRYILKFRYTKWPNEMEENMPCADFSIRCFRLHITCTPADKCYITDHTDFILILRLHLQNV